MRDCARRISWDWDRLIRPPFETNYGKNDKTATVIASEYETYDHSVQHVHGPQW